MCENHCNPLSTAEAPRKTILCCRHSDEERSSYLDEAELHQLYHKSVALLYISVGRFHDSSSSTSGLVPAGRSGKALVLLSHRFNFLS